MLWKLIKKIRNKRFTTKNTEKPNSKLCKQGVFCAFNNFLQIRLYDTKIKNSITIHGYNTRPLLTYACPFTAAVSPTKVKNYKLSKTNY